MLPSHLILVKNKAPRIAAVRGVEKQCEADRRRRRCAAAGATDCARTTTASFVPSVRSQGIMWLMDYFWGMLNYLGERHGGWRRL